MKRFLALFLGLAMLLSLTACGGQPGAAGGGVSSSGTPAASSSAPGGEEPARPSGGGEIPKIFTLRPTIEETVLVDEKDVKITATGLNYNNYSAQLDLVLENNSAQDLSFSTGTLACNCNSVNGYMVDGLYFSTDIPAGKKSNESVSIGQDDLIMMGITDIADIELGFRISDDDYDDYLVTGPIQLKTSLAGSYDDSEDTYQTALNSGALSAALNYSVDQFSAEELYSEQGVRVVSEALITNRDGEQAILLEIENTSDRRVNVRTGQFRINGLQVQSGAWSSDDINAGKRRVLGLRLTSMLDSGYWDLFGITDIGSVDFTLGLTDPDGNLLCDGREVSIVIPGADASYSDAGDLAYSGNEIRIVAKGIVPDSLSYSDDIHVLFLVENGSPSDVNVDVGYDTLSVNGYMTSFIAFGGEIPAGWSRVMDVELMGYSLEENGIGEVADIADVEMTFEIRDRNYKTIAEPVVTIGEGGKPVAEPASGTAPGVSPEFKKLMDDCETFFDEYAAFMASYQESGASSGLLTDYISILSRYAEMSEKLEEIDEDSLSAADAAYYVEVMTRISDKLAESGA